MLTDLESVGLRKRASKFLFGRSFVHGENTMRTIIRRQIQRKYAI